MINGLRLSLPGQLPQEKYGGLDSWNGNRKMKSVNKNVFALLSLRKKKKEAKKNKCRRSIYKCIEVKLKTGPCHSSGG
jgi:hypothetical protein